MSPTFDHGTMGRAISEAEDRRSLNEAIEHGWPIEASPTGQGKSRPPVLLRARQLADELRRSEDETVREAGTLLGQLANQVAAQPDPVPATPDLEVDRMRLAEVLKRVDGYQLARAVAIRNGTLDVYLAKADALILKLPTIYRGERRGSGR